MRDRIPLVLLALALCGGSLFLSGCLGSKSKTRKVPMNLHSMKIGEKEFLVEIAADPDRREVGLMYRPSLETDRGMLFIFPQAQLQSFWMKNCIMDIDLAYIDDDGKIVDIHRMKALPKGFNGQLPRYPSSTEVRYVLEMADGWFDAHGVKVGDPVEGYKGPTGVRVR